MSGETFWSKLEGRKFNLLHLGLELTCVGHTYCDSKTLNYLLLFFAELLIGKLSENNNKPFSAHSILYVIIIP